MLITDGAGGALAVNTKWMELSGLGRSESLGQGWLDALNSEVRYRLREDVLRVAGTGDGTTVDYQLDSATGRRWARWWVSRHELDGIPLVAVAAADIEDDYARQQNLYHLATHDSLTGLVNRSHFVEAIEQAMLRGQRQSRHVAVVYVDLDGFKRVNDRGGHSLGDRVLNAIAARLRHAVRAADMVARIGGDEFAVLCEGLSVAEQADVVARRISVALTESVELDGERWSVAASVGAAVDRGDPENAEDLIDRADRAMYSIKLTRRTSDRPTERQPERRRATDAPYQPGPAPEVAPTGRPVEADYHDREAPPARGDAVYADRFRGENPAAGRSQSERYGEHPTDVGALDPDEARRALRDLAEAAGAFRTPAPSAQPEPRPDTDPARHRLAADVLHLRESIDSIRRMLDRLLATESGVIDIREQHGRYERH
jgi:diguanylate cyclase (GGDEF)-like protein/PAS domain S-box-containing protein